MAAEREDIEIETRSGSLDPNNDEYSDDFDDEQDIPNFEEYSEGEDEDDDSDSASYKKNIEAFRRPTVDRSGMLSRRRGSMRNGRRAP